jgi:Skp family chaperone for outer membrane proteins
MKVIPFLFAAAFSANVFAHNIAVLSYAKLESDSKVSKNIAEQIKVRQEKLQAEVTALQGTVQKKVEELEKASSVLTAKALEQKKESLQKELIKMDEDLKKKAQKLEEIKNETLVKVNETIKGIASDIAKAKKYDAVLSDASVVYSQPELDITNDVLSELDKKLPKLQINWDKK